jgi:tetratricopeptide (TPR) repeat protein
MMTKRLAIPLYVLLAQPALAKPIAQPAVVREACERIPECMGHAERGRTLAREGKHAEAAAEYSAAYNLAPAPWLLYNLARRLHEAGRLDEAAIEYQRYLDLGAAEDPTQLGKARDFLAQIRRPLEKAPLTQSVASTLDPSASTSPDAQATVVVPKTPVFKKWWFWTVLGITAAGVATAIGIGVYAGTGPNPNGLPAARPFPD